MRRSHAKSRSEKPRDPLLINHPQFPLNSRFIHASFTSRASPLRFLSFLFPPFFFHEDDHLSANILFRNECTIDLVRERDDTRCVRAKMQFGTKS